MTLFGLAKALLITAAVLYLALGITLMLVQRKILYRPDPTRVSPAAAGLNGVTEIEIASPDGARLVAWHLSAPVGRPTLLYFHGNGGSIAGRTDRIRDLERRHLGVLILSYRGYGGSTGSPSEAANVADGLLAYDELRRRGIAPRDVILFGESLGTGVATQVAGLRPSAGLVLDSPYTSIADIAALLYPVFPVRLVLWDQYETSRHIERVSVPILILHGAADEVVPVTMGRRIHALAGRKAEIATYPGAGHLDHRRLGSFDRLQAWIERVRATSSAD